MDGWMDLLLFRLAKEFLNALGGNWLLLLAFDPHLGTKPLLPPLLYHVDPRKSWRASNRYPRRKQRPRTDHGPISSGQFAIFHFARCPA